MKKINFLYKTIDFVKVQTLPWAEDVVRAVFKKEKIYVV